MFIALLIEGLGMLEQIPLFLLLLLLAFGGLLAWNYAYWKRFDYEIKDNVLEIRSGVFSRRKREVPLKRVQNVDVRENVFQQALGIAELRFETAGGGTTEAVLRYVSSDDVELLRRRYQSFKEGREIKREEPDKDRLLYEIEPIEMGILCLTSYSLASTIGIFGFIIFILFTFDQALNIDIGLLAESIILFGGGLIVLSFLGAWLFNAGRKFISYYNFKLYKSGDTLKYRRGIFRRYSGTIPLDKLQNITIKENLLQRLIGYGGLDIDTAGYSAQQRAETGAEVAIPITKIGNIPKIIKEVEGVEVTELNHIAERAMQRYGVRYSILAILISAGTYYFIELTPAILIGVVAVLFIGALTAAYLKWIHKGYQVLDNYLMTRNGFWRRNTKIVPYYRIQNIIVQSTFLQRRWSLASVIPDTAGTYLSISGEIVATDLDKNDAEELGDKVFEELQRSLVDYRERKLKEKEERKKRQQKELDDDVNEKETDSWAEEL